MDKKEENKEKDDEEQPGTSAGPSNAQKPGKDEEIIRLLAKTDEILENKAKSMNLSSLNVRSILHHLIKYPSTIDVLLGIRENDELPSVRNTRSRRRPDDSAPNSAVQTPNKLAYRIEDKRPKNFLDVEYEEDDEFDADYIDDDEKSPKANTEDEDEEEEEDVEDEEFDDELDEEEVEEVEEFERSHVAEEIPEDSILLFEQEEFLQPSDSDNLHITLNDTLAHRPDSTAPVATLDTVADDEDYSAFVKAIQYPKEDSIVEMGPMVGGDDDEEDQDDEDYNVIAESLNVEDWDETRQDKTTMIPRHEVKALMMDTLLAEGEIPINAIPEEVIIGGEEKGKTQKAKDQEVCERLNTSLGAHESSCSLLNPPRGTVTFTMNEIAQLQTQLLQHVQLLTQFVVTCHHDVNLSHVRNAAQIMLNELDDKRQSSTHTTLFDVENLDAGIESCHDINGFPAVEEMCIDWARDTEGVPGMALRPEAVVVLGRSGAIRFPKLLPPTQPVFIEKPLPFLHEENVMLAMALLQFAHLPRRAEKGTIDRYSVIAEHCLPGRTAYKVRSHLKTMRRNMANPTPIHLIIQAAEQGICNLSIPLKIWETCSTAICSWPEDEQPNWFRMFHKKFTVTDDNHIHRKSHSKIILTPVKKNLHLQKQNSEILDSQKSEEPDDVEFVEVGKGPGGQSVVLDREHLEELVMQLIQEKNTSPSKRRKNSTPMKVPQIPTISNNFEERILNSEAMTSSKIQEIQNARKSSAVRNLRGPNYGYQSQKTLTSSEPTSSESAKLQKRKSSASGASIQKKITSFMNSEEKKLTSSELLQNSEATTSSERRIQKRKASEMATSSEEHRLRSPSMSSKSSVRNQNQNSQNPKTSKVTSSEATSSRLSGGSESIHLNPSTSSKSTSSESTSSRLPGGSTSSKPTSSVTVPHKSLTSSEFSHRITNPTSSSSQSEAITIQKTLTSSELTSSESTTILKTLTSSQRHSEAISIQKTVTSSELTSSEPTTSESTTIQKTLTSSQRHSESISIQKTVTSSCELDFDAVSTCSFQIPPTPGRRSPDDDDFFLDLESNSLMWTGPDSIPFGNPLTPRGYSEDDPIDFSLLATSSSPTTPSSTSEAHLEHVVEPRRAPRAVDPPEVVAPEAVDDESSLTGFDLVPPDEDDDVAYQRAFRAPFRSKDDPNPKQSRKRTRNERETEGALGLHDKVLIEQQTNVVIRKIVDDVKQRLFMHTDTWHRLSTVMQKKSISHEQRYLEMKEILKHHPELFRLLMLYAPVESLPSHLYSETNIWGTKAAMEMIMVIERYVAAAKLKEPSIRSVFRYIRSFLEETPSMSGQQATARFFQLLGQDRPLWSQLESNFWCLPYTKTPTIEEMEFVDMSGVEKLASRKERKERNLRVNYETIDDIDEVIPMKCQKTSESERPNNLVVKCGELCIHNETDDTYIQLEITERQWTRKDDILLLTRFNEAIKADPTFSEEQMPSIVPEFSFGAKSIVARLKYLLEQLRCSN